MSPISKTGIAQQIARTRAVGGRARLGAAQDAPADIGTPESPPPFDFDTDLARRVDRIGRDDPRRRQRVVEAFLESCVARTFGSAAPSDPAFGRVIEQAREAIASDPELSAAMSRLVDRLAPREPDPPSPPGHPAGAR